VIIAALFFNFAFWDVGGPGGVSGPYLVVCSAAEAAVISALFFLGPALRAWASRRNLIEAAAESFGTFAAFAFRALCILYLIIWISACADGIFRIGLVGIHWDPSRFEEKAVVGLLVMFLFATALAGMRSNAILAAFTSKLALALLVAALIRARAGIPITWTSQSYVSSTSIVRDLSEIGFYAAPLLLLASSFGGRCQSKRDIWRIGTWGIALPMVISMTGATIIIGAGYLLGYHHPSIPLNLGAVLMHGDSRRYWPMKAALIAITMFGLVRFGAWALGETASPRVRTLAMTFSGIAIAVMSPLNLELQARIMESLTLALIAVSGILTADAMICRWRRPRRVPIDLIGIVAFISGWTVPYSVPYLFWWFPDPWGHPWILPAYGVAFAACLAGRAVEYRAKIATPRTSPV
jgi:hypothetical protein